MIRKKAVTGSRDWTDWITLVAVLDGWQRECEQAGDQLMVVVGDCPTGADALARAWCEANDVHQSVYCADWDLHGKAAGPIRNREMAKANPEECAAFPLKGNGTWDCVKQMNRAGIPVRIVPERKR